MTSLVKPLPRTLFEIQPFGQAVNYGTGWQRTDKFGDINAVKNIQIQIQQHLLYTALPFPIPAAN